MASSVTFKSTDLGISDDAIAQITAQLANGTNPDPIGDAIARQSQKVTDYTLRYDVPAERLMRLIRVLVLFDLYSNPALGVMPPNVASMNKEAMTELTDIRDGKFHDLRQLTPEDPTLSPALGETGGERKVHFGRHP